MANAPWTPMDVLGDSSLVQTSPCCFIGWGSMQCVTFLDFPFKE